jgi:protein-disulfide isomerase
VVEFFDYNSPYTRRAASDMVDLIKSDGKLKFVLKEFPVLGEGSLEAARVAVAVRMQDETGGQKYLEFHQKLLSSRGPANKTRALAAAREVGLDVIRVQQDMGSNEVRVTLKESLDLAEALHLDATPIYIVGTEIVRGAVGLNALKEKVNSARSHLSSNWDR